jgi:hypothetical protein
MSRQLFSTVGYTLGAKESSELEGISIGNGADATALASGPCTGIYVTTAGNVAGTLASGGAFLLTGLVARQIVKINASIIADTLTTATGIYALYPAGNL